MSIMNGTTSGRHCRGSLILVLLRLPLWLLLTTVRRVEKQVFCAECQSIYTVIKSDIKYFYLSFISRAQHPREGCLIVCFGYWSDQSDYHC